MTGHRTRSPESRDPAARSLYGSNAYASSNEASVAERASEWLEAQAVHPFIKETGRRAMDYLDLQTGEAVLEVGCGTGVFLPALAAAVGERGSVVAIDHAASFLAQAQERIAEAGVSANVTLREADAMALPFPDDSFDAAHCERVLMHLEDPAGAIVEMRRVVRPGGRVVAAEVFAEGATTDHPDPETNTAIFRAMVSGIRNPRMGIQLRRLFLRAGLEDVRGTVVADFETELDPDEMDEYRSLSRELTERGQLDVARATAAAEAVVEYVARGEHCGTALMFVVAGGVPAR